LVMPGIRDVVTRPESRRRYETAGLWAGATLTGMLREHAQIAPGALAVVDGTDGRTVTYGELWDDVVKFSSYLIANGIRPGDVVSVQLPNRYEAVVADLGALAAGAILNPLLPNYRSHELAHILNWIGTKVIVTAGFYRGFDFSTMIDELRKEKVPSLDLHVVLDGQRGIPGADKGTGETAAGPSGEASIGLPELDAADVSEIVFTSGTEAIPKAVMHTENTANCAVQKTFEFLGMAPSDVVWMPSPVGHSTGLNFGIRFAIYLGLPLVLQDAWDARRAIELISAYRCSFTLAATTFLSDLLDAAAHEPGCDLSSMRFFSCGGAPVTAELVRAADERGIGVLRLYGATETLSATWMPVNAGPAKKAATDGAVMPHVALEVRDEAGAKVSNGTPGELVVRSANTAVGLFNDPERTARTFLPDGWVRTGDLGTLDDEGYVTVIGRLKEIIIRGGLNIAPREIEDELSQMPGVRAVAVLGLPNERLGEITCACIVADPARPAVIELAEVAAFLEGRGVAKYKFPQRIERVPELPMTPSGKVQKHVLRAALLPDSVPSLTDVATISPNAAGEDRIA
jgi:acyl-CoA synthetase (AMP-forming)/AMP-acid ligase II